MRRLAYSLLPGLLVLTLIFAGGCGGGSDSGGNGGGDTSEPGVDYSVYSGDYSVTGTVTDSSNPNEIGESLTVHVTLSVTSGGVATLTYQNKYCGEVTFTGQFSGSQLALSTNSDGWNCSGTTCCNGKSTVTATFTDTNNATGTIRGESCCNSSWHEHSATFIRQ